MSMKQKQHIGALISTDELDSFIILDNPNPRPIRNWIPQSRCLADFDVMICLSHSTNFGTCEVLTRNGFGWVILS